MLIETNSVPLPTDPIDSALAEAIQIRSALAEEVRIARRYGSPGMIQAAERRFREQSRAVAALAADAAFTTEEMPV